MVIEGDEFEWLSGLVATRRWSIYFLTRRILPYALRIGQYLLDWKYLKGRPSPLKSRASVLVLWRLGTRIEDLSAVVFLLGSSHEGLPFIFATLTKSHCFFPHIFHIVDQIWYGKNAPIPAQLRCTYDVSATKFLLTSSKRSLLSNVIFKATRHLVFSFPRGFVWRYNGSFLRSEVILKTPLKWTWIVHRIASVFHARSTKVFFWRWDATHLSGQMPLTSYFRHLSSRFFIPCWQNRNVILYPYASTSENEK